MFLLSPRQSPGFCLPIQGILLGSRLSQFKANRPMTFPCSEVSHNFSFPWFGFPCPRGSKKSPISSPGPTLAEQFIRIRSKSNSFVWRSRRDVRGVYLAFFAITRAFASRMEERICMDLPCVRHSGEGFLAQGALGTRETITGI